jgi:hypothetical protein
MSARPSPVIVLLICICAISAAAVMSAVRPGAGYGPVAGVMAGMSVAVFYSYLRHR